MKRLNRKGFTLVELLAVIVILAIVVGITLVTVLPTLKKSRQEAFELTAQTAADYFEKQYQLYLIGEDASGPMTGLAAGSSVYFNSSLAKLVGLKPENYVAGNVRINSNTGRACVILYASTNETKAAGIYNLAGTAEAGEYYDATATGEEKLPVKTSEGSADITFNYSRAWSSGC